MSVCERTYRELLNLKVVRKRFWLVMFMNLFQGKRMEKLPELTWRTEYRDIWHFLVGWATLRGKDAGLREWSPWLPQCTGKLNDNIVNSAGNEHLKTITRNVKSLNMNGKSVKKSRAVARQNWIGKFRKPRISSVILKLSLLQMPVVSVNCNKYSHTR